MAKFHRGDIVWGKMKFCSWWPAIVLDPNDCGIKSTSPNKYALFWFGDYTISHVKTEKISRFKENFQKWSKSERVKEAVNEALSVLAAANDLTFDSVSALIKWADAGFPTTVNWEVKFQWTKPDLPQLILKALPKKTEALADKIDEEDDVKKMISKVRIGEKSLEEICIGCCKEDATLVQSHPLFLGKVCIKCTKDVNRANNLPCGSYQKYCIVCGQGGRLVYCSKKMCSRAFCKECIDYLDSEDAFTKITSLDDWLCYICNPIKKEDCLIRRRAKKRKIESPVNDSLPVSKSARRDRSSSKIDCVITAVINGIKDLDDVCIACCKEGVELICDHPLFKGKICKKCKKDVMKICNLPCGKFYNFCIVCGQGGSIVYCSNDICSRAFCNVCIEYLDSEEAFAEITSLDKWPCYLCEPVKRPACLIRKRTMEQGIKNTASNQIPLSKSVNKKNQNAPNQVHVSKSMKKDVKNSAAYQIPDSKSMKQNVKKAPNLVPVSKSVKQEQNTTPNQIPVYKSVKQKVKNAASNQIPVSKSMKQKTINTALNEVPVSKSAHRARSSSSLGDVIFKIVTGRKNLEDVCIACCREDVELLCNHPLFIGKICKRCYKDVMKICSQPCGKYQDFCIVCGQGGSLVYCSNDGCLRAYCQPCIEYLDCRNNSYKEIVEADSWSCYLCKPNLKKNCLIRKREIHEGLIDTPPTSPDAKFSENSFDSDEIVSAPDTATNDGQFEISNASPAADKTSTAFDNASHNGENVSFDTSASGKTEEPSDSAVENELMDYSTESSCDSSTKDKAFEKCLAATSPKGSSSKKASATDNVVDDKALGNCFFATSSKTSSTKKGISSSSIVLSEIRAGKRYLEDICISCRKIDVEIFTNHPWLIGGICPHCHTALTIFKDLEPDQRKNFCAICGQESSSFLCCSYKDCSRAYCKICVEYLDSKEAFAVNLMDKNWICYLSEAYKKHSFKEDQLLIKQRYLVKHRKYSTRKDRSRLSYLSKVEGDLKKNVQKGAVKIEDICIACHKSEYELMEKSHTDLVVHHPLFFGSICESCVHDVATACKLPYGKKQNVCIICGQHESLVHCSNEECSRAYCQKCIEYLDSELAFKKALKDTYWECYLCKFSRNEKCIIRRRFPPDNYAYDCEERLAVYTPEQSIDINKKKLWKGELTLKDVCIACLDLLTDYSMPHPLFKGKVCLKCFNEVHKVCNLISGTMHDQCVLCSQGGKLVYCSNVPCQRAYCKLCIKCLDIEDAYPKILQIKKWYCYYCNLHPSSRSFIQRKAIHMKGIKNFPEVPKIDDRSPINVLATNDRGQHALRKAKIKVDRYDYNRPSSSVGEESVLYDLVLGSFFVEDYQKPKEKLVEDFFRNFILFNNRRIGCGFHHNVFFIFIADYILMDADILCEVAEKIHAQRQFHKIQPVLFQFGERKFLAWSNLSFCMSSAMDKIDAGPYIDKHCINAGRYADDETVEKEIYYSFVKYLKNFFKAKD